MYNSDDTISAIATPAGEGGLGVVRVSGTKALEIADTMFHSSSGQKLKDKPSHTLTFGQILTLPGELVDEAIAAIYKAPHSYTGENVVEFFCHGGTLVLKRVLELTTEYGTRLAGPGEFTLRAFLNGKIDLAQAEAVCELVQANSETARKMATLQLNGRLSNRIKTLRNQLLELLSELEANLDFEEDVPPVTPEQLETKLVRALADFDVLLRQARIGKITRQGVKVAIAGKPNAGKSSLFNSLLGEQRVIVTPEPGTTRDSIAETITIGGHAFVLTDTAGLRNNLKEAAQAEHLGIERTRETISDSDGIIVVADGSRPLEPEDNEVINLCLSRQVIVAVNKCDLPQRLDNNQLRESLSGRIPLPPILSVSALTGEGLPELTRTLQTFIPEFKETIGPGQPEIPVISNQRHITLLETAYKEIMEAKTGLESSVEIPCLAINLRNALEALGKITGESVTEDILETIFSKFCIGK